MVDDTKSSSIITQPNESCSEIEMIFVFSFPFFFCFFFTGYNTNHELMNVWMNGNEKQIRVRLKEDITCNGNEQNSGASLLLLLLLLLWLFRKWSTVNFKHYWIAFITVNNVACFFFWYAHSVHWKNTSFYVIFLSLFTVSSSCSSLPVIVTQSLL